MAVEQDLIGISRKDFGGTKRYQNTHKKNVKNKIRIPENQIPFKKLRS